MALMPKRVKYRKSQKGRVKGNATRGNYVAFGEYGIQSLEAGRISAQTIEAGRVVASQAVKGGGKLYIRIFPHKSVTAIPAETRMGKGKGEVEFWAAVVKPGTDPLRGQRPERGGRPRGLRPRRPQDARATAGSSPAGPRSEEPESQQMSKPAELREQTDEQLDLLLKEVQNNLFRLRLQSETERLEAPSEIVKAKREIARIKTILRQREIEREKSPGRSRNA